MSASSFEFYQINGFRGQTNSWFHYDEEKLCNTVFNTLADDEKPSKLELILGIIPNGASYLLMTSDQMSTLTRSHTHCRPNGRPSLATQFTSLSPIIFRSVEELLRKVKTYSTQARKKKSAQNNRDIDTSRANKAFFLTDSTDVFRANFEHQRIFLRIISRTLDPGIYCIPEVSWHDTSVVRALCINTWDSDNRPRSEQEKNPKLLNIAWADVTPANLLSGHLEGDFHSVDVILQENSLFNLRGRRRESCRYGQTNTLDKDALTAYLQDAFIKQRPGAPLILLVHDAKITLNALKVYGIDTAAWHSDFKALLGYDTLAERMAYSRNRLRQDYGRSNQYHASSSRRSRSPPSSKLGWTKREPSPGYRDSRERDWRSDNSRSYRPHQDHRSSRPSDTKPLFLQSKNSPPLVSRSAVRQVFLVDIETMYNTLFKGGQRSSLLSIAKSLGFSVDPKVCLLIQLWLAMASGGSVDEARTEAHSAKSEANSDSRLAEAGERDLSDDEQDPNDVPVSKGKVPQGNSATTYDYFSDSEDDEYDDY
ncbi:hypothetical protein BD410DRAFT_826908 [Rickenella mellea]|uniref:Uncharacterized protein n=1 Tax=Rickenella mellea TaxID=50990 RepID=A0A4Y7QBM5_9AGAM|nr:hypothetical protein BD410DRAFT_826908 [Rickenella mellea]